MVRSRGLEPVDGICGIHYFEIREEKENVMKSIIEQKNIKLKKNQFYKAKDYVNGMASPGGYFFTVEVTKNTVKFIVLEEPVVEAGKYGTFTVERNDFCNLVEAQVFRAMMN